MEPLPLRTASVAAAGLPGPSFPPAGRKAGTPALGPGTLHLEPQTSSSDTGYRRRNKDHRSGWAGGLGKPGPAGASGDHRGQGSGAHEPGPPAQAPARALGLGCLLLFWSFNEKCSPNSPAGINCKLSLGPSLLDFPHPSHGSRTDFENKIVIIKKSTVHNNKQHV